MADDTPIIGGSDQQATSRKALEDAAIDAQHLMAQSPIIPKLVAVDIIARRIFLLIRSGLEQEIVNGWDIEEPGLVLQTLGMSAQEKAVEEPGTPESLRQELLETVLPVIDIFCQMQIEHESNQADAETNQEETVLPGGDPGEAGGLGTVLRGTEGDEVEQTGEHGEGSCGQEDEA